MRPGRIVRNYITGHTLSHYNLDHLSLLGKARDVLCNDEGKLEQLISRNLLLISVE
jgi:hypothetical protein